MQEEYHINNKYDLYMFFSPYFKQQDKRKDITNRIVN